MRQYTYDLIDSNRIRAHNHLVHKQTLKHLDIACVSSKEFLDSQATIKCRFTLKRVFDMIITYSYNLITFFLYLIFFSFCFLNVAATFALLDLLGEITLLSQWMIITLR